MDETSIVAGLAAGDRPEAKDSLIRRTLRRRWFQILTRWGILTTALAGGIWYGLRPTYRASALIRVSPATPDLYHVNGVEKPGDLESFLATQVQLARSPNVLAAVATHPRVAVLPRISQAADPAAEVRRVVTVEQVPGTYLIEVAMACESPAEAAAIVNAVVEAYVEATVEWTDGMTRAQIKSLEVYLSDLKKQSGDLESRWKELVARGEQVPKVTRAQPGAFGAAEVGFEQYKAMRSRVFEMTMELTQAVELANKARRDAETIAASPGSNEDPTARAQARPDADLKAREAEDRVKLLQASQSALKREFDKLRLEEPTKPALDAIEIERIRRSLQTLDSMQDAVIRRLEQLRFEARGEARIRPVNVATAPTKPIVDRRPAAIAAIPAPMFLLVLAYCAAIEARDRRRESIRPA